ncbi:glycosyltransferase [Nocardiopsis ansamitocini]|uniref:4,4'-diaponeurosporenoate glycosyltransferase n=1 Tax=Nocardiopsis ansamitocini TaxID=1670832 RepID=A0A9W6P7P1_9ACTN|nr:glycosyltransferase [Nocardiopsis ansamitocini]GLU48579.1 glycosyl transferase [Nocardiopsis ansamitocini]
MIQTVAVVVPANDEAPRIERCLRAIADALAASPLAPDRCHLVVVADDCRDATAALARARGAHVLEVAHRSVGAARATGMRYALGRSGAHPAHEIWLATTDADSVVPRRWLTAQLGYAAAGWDAVVGTVAVADWSRRPPGLAEAFARQYDAHREEHPHVHGANLGVRASAYLDVGGFAPLARAEDHALVAGLGARGHRIRRPVDLPVRTSARSAPRAPGGFGDRLTDIAAGIG